MECLLADIAASGRNEESVSELLTAHELSMFRNAPEDELVDLAVDLDVPVPEEINLSGLLDACLRNLADLGKREGLPLSDYDKDDLLALSEAELRAISTLNGVDVLEDESSRVPLTIKSGKKIYKMWRKTRPKSQIPMYLPMLLAALARHLVSESA
jgi:hypothetical protein